MAAASWEDEASLVLMERQVMDTLLPKLALRLNRSSATLVSSMISKICENHTMFQYYSRARET